MSNRKYECARCRTSPASEWESLSDHVAGPLKAGGPLKSSLPRYFRKDDADIAMIMAGYGEARMDFHSWSGDAETTAWYSSSIMNYNAGVKEACGLVLVREIPPPLVLNCQLSFALVASKASFNASFTALSGSQVLQIQGEVPEVWLLSHLMKDVADAAEATELLQSRNQTVHILLGGEATCRPGRTVLWNKAAGTGLLAASCLGPHGSHKGPEQNLPVSANAASKGQLEQPKINDRIMVLRPPWLDYILEGSKTMELRGRKSRNGMVWLGCNSKIYGRATITSTVSLTAEEFRAREAEHLWPADLEIPYRNPCGLMLEDVIKLPAPIPYWQPPSALGWNVYRREETDWSMKTSSNRKAKKRGLDDADGEKKETSDGVISPQNMAAASAEARKHA